MQKQTIAIIILATSLFLIIQYTFLSNWINNIQQEIDKNFLREFEQGQISTAKTIFEQTNDCNTSTITLVNFNRQLIDTICVIEKLKKLKTNFSI